MAYPAKPSALLTPLAAVIALANSQMASAIEPLCPAQITVDAIEAEDSDSTTSLAEALGTVNNCPGNSTVIITVAESLAGKTDNISGAPYSVDASKNLTLNGPTTGDFTVTTAAADSILLYVNESARADIRDINFAGKDAETRSAELLNVGGATLNLTRVDFDNIVSTSTHALLNIDVGAQVSIDNSQIRNNNAPWGAIGASGSNVPGDTGLTIRNSTLSGNTATYRGGALYTFDTDLTIEDSIFDGNQAKTDSDSSGGGAIFNAGEYGTGNTIIRNSSFRNNQARNYGGAIYQSSLASFTVEDSVFENNTVTAASNEFGQGVYAEAHGGALTLDRSGTSSITRTRFSGNSATSRGGAVYIGRSGRNGTVTIADSTFTNNSATYSASETTLPYGGAISTEATVSDPYSLLIRRSTFSGNSATGSANASAGALHAMGAGVLLSVENTTFDNNTSVGFGGALSLQDLPGASLSHITATDNSSTGTANVAAGFLYASTPGANIEISHTVFHGNTSGNANGGNICVSSEFSYDAVLDYSYWDGVNNTAGGCRAPLTDTSVITSSADPKLAALADNGGNTQTRYPAADSPLINAGNASIENAPETDQRGNSRISRDTIDIGAVEYGNLPPVGTTADAQTINRGEELTLDTSNWFSDPENDSLTYSASDLPAGISLDASSGILSGSVSAAGTYNITVTAQDAYGLSDSVVFVLNVLNLSPVGTTPDALTLNSGEEIALNATDWFSDPEDDSLSFTATGLPAGITLDGETGEISGSSTVAGSYSITVTAEDADGLSNSVVLELTITAQATGSGSKSGGALPLWMLLLGAASLLRRRH